MQGHEPYNYWTYWGCFFEYPIQPISRSMKWRLLYSCFFSKGKGFCQDSIFHFFKFCMWVTSTSQQGCWQWVLEDSPLFSIFNRGACPHILYMLLGWGTADESMRCKDCSLTHSGLFQLQLSDYRNIFCLEMSENRMSWNMTNGVC